MTPPPSPFGYQLTHDFIDSQRRVGVGDDLIADQIAKNNPDFAGKLMNIKIESEKYSNPSDMISAFLNHQVYGDATHKPKHPLSPYAQAEDGQTPSGSYAQGDINNSGLLGGAAKQLYNVGNSFLHTGMDVAKGIASAPFHDAQGNLSLNIPGNLAGQAHQGLKSVATAGSALVADAYQGVTGNQMPTFHPDGTTTTDGPTPEQQQFEHGMMNSSFGLQDLAKGDVNTAAQKTVRTLQEDPGKIALLLSPLTRPRPVGTGKLGPISTASDMVGQGIDYAATKIKESADNTVQAARQKFVKDLVTPIQTKDVKLDQVSRTTEKGFGPFKKSVVESSPAQKASEKVLADVPDVSPSNTLQGNYNAIQKEVGYRDSQLEETLSQPENSFQIRTGELKGGLKRVSSDLESSPLIVGDAEKAANKMLSKANQLIDQAAGEEKVIQAADVLRIRKDFDRWVGSQKDLYAGGGMNALKLANKAVRDYLNGTLDKYAPNAGVKTALSGQHSLLSAMDTVGEKAAIEADSAMGRFLQKVQTKVGRVRVLSTGAAGMAGTAGAFYLAPAAATTAAGLGAAGFGAYEAYRLVTSPKTRYLLSNALRLLEKAAITDPSLTPLIQEGNALIRGEIPNATQSFMDPQGPYTAADNLDDVPLSQMSEQGVADAAASQKVIDAGGTLDDAMNAAIQPKK